MPVFLKKPNFIERLKKRKLYLMTNLQELLIRTGMNMNMLVPTLLGTKDGSTILSLTDGDGQLISANELKLLAMELLKTAENPGYDEAIKVTNKKSNLESYFGPDPDDKSKCRLPIDSLGIRKKQFKSNRKWSFKCGNCSTRVSNVENTDYFSILPTNHINFGLERGCSEECTYVIAKEILQNWLKENEYEPYFNTDNLEIKLKKYIQNIK